MLEQKLNELGIHTNQIMMKQFDQFYHLLIEWNKVMNLTGITDYDEVVEKHFVDSLSLAKSIDLLSVESVIDVGTGAGFPGIPLKIAFPHLRIVLLDSLNKRIRFLNEVIEQLNLKEIQTIHGRAEEFAKKKDYREEFDLCVSRAVANLSVLCEYCIPYIRVGGMFISYKSGEVDKEVYNSENAIHLLGGVLEKVDKFELPGTDIHRSFVVIKKSQHTKSRYPRKAGIPAKEPL